MPRIKYHGVPGFPKRYRGWTIWKWTGWKGQTYVFENGDEVRAVFCRTCFKQFCIGDVLYRSQSEHDAHWLCQFPDNRLETLHAQWLAKKADKYVYSNCGMMVATIPAGTYRPGDSFDIIAEYEAITEETPEAMKAVAVKHGFDRLKYVIDELESPQCEA